MEGMCLILHTFPRKGGRPTRVSIGIMKQDNLVIASKMDLAFKRAKQRHRICVFDHK